MLIIFASSFKKINPIGTGNYLNSTTYFLPIKVYIMLPFQYRILVALLFLSIASQAQWDRHYEHATNAKHEFSIENFWLGSSERLSDEIPNTGLLPTRYLQHRLAYQYNITPAIGLKTGIGIQHEFTGLNREQSSSSFYNLPIRAVMRAHPYRYRTSVTTIPLFLVLRKPNPIVGNRFFFSMQAGLELQFFNSSKSGTSSSRSSTNERYRLEMQYYENNVPHLAGALNVRYLLNNSNFLSLGWYNTYRLQDNHYDIELSYSSDDGTEWDALTYAPWASGLQVAYTATLGKGKEASYRSFRKEQEDHRRTSIGVEVGIANDKFRIEESGRTMATDDLLNGIVGLNVTQELNDWMALETGFIRKEYYSGWRFITSPTGQLSNFALNWQVPLRARFTKSLLENRLKLHALTGVRYSYHTRGINRVIGSSGGSHTYANNARVAYSSEKIALANSFGLVEFGGGLSFMLFGEMDVHIFNSHVFGWKDVFQVDGTYQIDGGQTETFQLLSKGNFSTWGLQLKYPISRFWK